MKTECPLLSVIIPVYNVEKYIEKCLESVTRQSYRNLEIIVVDDCTKDNSMDVVKTFASKDPRIRILNHEVNKGLFQARITGVQASTGEYIAFVDSDDEITLDFYRPLIQKAEEEDADMVMGNTIMESENHWRFRYNSNFALTAERTLEGKEIFRHFFQNNGYCFSWHTVYNKIYSKRLWEKALPEYSYIEGRLVMTEDIAFSTVLYFYAEKMCFLPHDGYIYYRHAAASTGVSTSLDSVRSKALDVAMVFGFVGHFLEKQGVFAEYEENYLAWKNRYFRWNSWVVQDGINRLSAPKQEKKELKASFLSAFGKEEFEFANPDDGYFSELKSSWNPQLEDLIKLICDEKTQVVSFDIFDTLLLRPFWNPDDVFLVIAALIREQIPLYAKIPFYDMRIEAESSARRKMGIAKPGYEDVTLEEIYAEFGTLYNIPANVCTQIMGLENKVELECCYPRKTMRSMFELAQAVGKKVVLTSDMYLSKEVIENMLHKCGYSGYHKLLLSSDIRLLKHTGCLFDTVASEMGVSQREQILHIGDNYSADFLVAQQRGLRAFFVPKTKDVFANTVAELKTNDAMGIFQHPNGSLIKYTQAFKQLPIKCMMAVIANKYFDNPFYYSFGDHSNFNGDPYFMGLYPLGMMAFGFTKHILEGSLEKNYDRVHFLSRDGYLFQKIYEMMRIDIAEAPPSDYVYTSRKSLLPYQIREKTDFYGICNSLLITSHSPRDVLKMYAPLMTTLTPEQETEYFQRGVLLDKNFKNMADFTNFISAMLDISYREETASENRRAVQNYMESIFSGHDVTVDLGYSGALQSILCDLAGHPIDTFFLYGNGYKTNQVAREHGFHVDAFYDYSPSGSVSVRETIVMENGPSCVGYQVDGNGVVPVFEKCRLSYIEQYVYDELHRGALDFAAEILHHFPRWRELFDVRGTEVAAPFENFIVNATDFDRQVFAYCYMEDEVHSGEKSLSLKHIWQQDCAANGGTQTSPAVAAYVLPAELKDLYTDGLFVKLYQKINKFAPKGSRRREWIKKIAKPFMG